MKLFLEQDIFCNFPEPGAQMTILEKKRTACLSDGENFFSRLQQLMEMQRPTFKRIMPCAS